MTDSSKSALSLISTHQGYSESEQRIVDYILEHQSEAPRLTAAQLSRAAATSEATVSRFCRKLGFGSFRSFQFSLARDLESQRNEGLTDEVSLDNMEQSLKNILAAKVSELNATIDGIDHDTLAAVVHALKSRRYCVCGRRQHQRRRARRDVQVLAAGPSLHGKHHQRDLDWFCAHACAPVTLSC